MSINRATYIIFNGHSSNEFDLAITGMNTYNSPERDYTLTSIAGRNGDMFTDNKRYKNITVEYTAVIGNNFKNKLSDIREWLLSPNGYSKLQDTYDIGLVNYREAIYSGPVEFNNIYDQGGSIKLKFNCKPQIFIDSPNVSMYQITSSPYRFNNIIYWMNSRPLIYIPGGTNKYGDITINNATILVNYKKVSFDEIPLTFVGGTYYWISTSGTTKYVTDSTITSKENLNSSVQYYSKVSTPAENMYIDCETFNAYVYDYSGAIISRNECVSFEGEPKTIKGMNTIVFNDLSYSRETENSTAYAKIYPRYITI